jgi:hypothetical protein
LFPPGHDDRVSLGRGTVSTTVFGSFGDYQKDGIEIVSGDPTGRRHVKPMGHLST